MKSIAMVLTLNLVNRILLPSVLCTALFFPAVASSALQGDSIWLVEKGDSVYSIARQVFPDDVAKQRQFRQQLVEQNAAIFNGNANQLSLGQKLTMPALSVSPVASTAPKALVPAVVTQKANNKTSEAIAEAPQAKPVQQDVEDVAADPQDVIGHVVVSVGEMQASNRGSFRKLLRHSEVLKGDTLSTSARTYTQIRMKDGALLSLRPNTKLKITDYRYNGKEDGSERSFMELINGGFRTITGYIGHRNKKNYRVKTAVATIGIRGTHYGLMVCEAGSCNAESASLKDGVYGGVVDGSIVVENDSGVATFNNDQYFHVASIHEAPVEQLIPPPIFHGKADAQSANAAASAAASAEESEQKAKQQGAEGQGSEQQLEEKVANAEQLFETAERRLPGGSALGSLVQSYVDDRRPPVILQDQVGEVITESSEVTSTAPTGAGVLVSFYEVDTLLGVQSPVAAPVIAGAGSNKIVLGTKIEANGAVISNLPIAMSEAASGAVHQLILPSGVNGISDINGAGISGVGVNWGRWSDNYVFTENGTVAQAVGDVHFIYTDRFTSPAELSQLSALGGLTASESYSFHGGTTPTNPSGMASTLVHISAVSDFVNGKLVNYQIAAQDQGANFAMQATNISFQDMNEFNLTASNCNAGCTGKASAAFVGNQAQGMITTYGIQDSAGGKGANGAALLIRDSLGAVAIPQ